MSLPVRDAATAGDRSSTAPPTAPPECTPSAVITAFIVVAVLVLTIALPIISIKKLDPHDQAVMYDVVGKTFKGVYGQGLHAGVPGFQWVRYSR
jgi:hypothetical protein